MLVAEVVHEMAMHAVVPRASPSVSSGQIRMNHLNQLFCSLRACVTLLCRRIDQMFQDVILDHFGDEPVQRSRHAIACCRIAAQFSSSSIRRSTASSWHGCASVSSAACASLFACVVCDLGLDPILEGGICTPACWRSNLFGPARQSNLEQGIR